MIAAMDGVDGHVRETWHLRDLTWVLRLTGG
jgi:hypothetical protein